jgi:hypothetical protein
MRTVIGGAIAATAAGAAARALNRLRRRSRRGAGPPETPSGWQVVTVNRSRAELMPQGRLPAPLAALGASVEVRLRDAPGARGTELGARPQAGRPDGAVPEVVIAAALREAKQLAETGEVLSADGGPR